MKKALVGIAALAALSIALTTGAYAHSSHGSHHTRSGSSSHRRYTLCTVKNCSAQSNHKHSGKTYAPHHASDGHRYH